MNMATAMLYLGKAQAMVAGSQTPTSEVLKPSLELRRLYPGIPPVTSCFIMQIKNPEYGSNGILIFADCAMNPEPSSAMLAQIAGASAKVAKQICNIEPKVAMLSFSTYGSSEHSAAVKIKEAVEIARRKFPEFEIDGELQVDAALVPWIAEKKAAGSKVAGKANVLVFPDLNSGNIAYKLVERLADARAIGPIVLGLNPVVNDLSRGCSVEDIINICAVASIQCSLISGKDER